MSFLSRRAFVLILLLFMAAPAEAQLPFLHRDKVSEYEAGHTTWVYPPWKHTWGVVRATQTHLTFFTLGRARFINPQGLAVVKLVATDDPDKKGDDDEVTVYGVNTGENSIIYNRSMKSIGLYGYGNLGVGDLNEPWDVAATPGGQVFVTDSRNQRVVKFRNTLGDLVYVSSFGRGDPANLVLPRGIAVTGGGRLAVADAGSNRIVLFDTSGVYQGEITGLLQPLGIEAVDLKTPYTRPRDSYIVVSDSAGARISKYRYDGTLMSRISVPDAVPCELPPHIGHLTTDIFHNVVATDSSNARILKFDRQLRFLDAWGEEGEGRGKFREPTGIAIWRRYGQTFVAEAGGAHYLWVGVDLRQPPRVTVDEDRQIMRIGLDLTERGRVEFELLDGEGNVLRKTSRIMRAYEAQFNWLVSRAPAFGKSSVEQPKLEAGRYTLRMHIRPTYSSRKVFEKVINVPVDLPPPLR